MLDSRDVYNTYVEYQLYEYRGIACTEFNGQGSICCHNCSNLGKPELAGSEFNCWEPSIEQLGITIEEFRTNARAIYVLRRS